MIGECGIRGMLELFVLVECKNKHSSGKDIVDAAVRLSDGGWKPSAGSIYPLLQKMEKECLIKASLRKQEKGRREITYVITPKGTHELEIGKENLEKTTNSMMMAINPILMRITQEFDDDEILEAKSFWKSVMDLRSHVMAEPRQELRHKRFIRLFNIAEREIELIKSELGLKK
ncbi:MAG: PadR family transcriptional regulator [Candidatus Micrarchaeota archaeon]